MPKTTPVKKRNPQDTTLRNLNATKRRLVALEQDVDIEKAKVEMHRRAARHDRSGGWRNYPP